MERLAFAQLSPVNEIGPHTRPVVEINSHDTSVGSIVNYK